jgi:hypothetical protein
VWGNEVKNQRHVPEAAGRLARLATVAGMAAVIAVGCGNSGQGPRAAGTAAAAATAASGTRGPEAPPPPSGATLAPSPFGSGDDLGDYPQPTPVGVVAKAAEIPRTETRPVERKAANRAVEIRVEACQEVPTLNGRPAPPGRSFIVLDTSWKNVIPLQPAKPKPQGGGRTYGAGGLGFGVARESAASPQQEPAMEPTPYLVGEVPKHVWLLTDNRYADSIDLQATAQMPGRLPTNRFLIPRLDDVLTGKLVFAAPAGARYVALLFLDTNYGNALVPVQGAPDDSPVPKTAAPAQRNELLELAVTEAGWADDGPKPPEGFRYFVVGLRGVSLSAGNIVQLDLNRYLFLQTEQAFVAQPEASAAWLRRPFTGLTPFLPGASNEGRAAFLLPADARQTMVLLRPPGGGPMDLPAPDRVKAAWPGSVATFTDGGTVKISFLPPGGLPPGFRPPPAGKQYLVLDLVAENLLPKGVELQPNQQFRLQDASGTFYVPMPESSRLAFRPSGRNVVPANAARRLQLLYVVPAGQQVRLSYRGFETTETLELPQPGGGR